MFDSKEPWFAWLVKEAACVGFTLEDAAVWGVQEGQESSEAITGQ